MEKGAWGLFGWPSQLSILPLGFVSRTESNGNNDFHVAEATSCTQEREWHFISLALPHASHNFPKIAAGFKKQTLGQRLERYQTEIRAQ